jgi:hypothetical protein
MRNRILQNWLIAVAVAFLFVGVVEGVLRLDRSPKALPFHDLRTGTLVDHLFLGRASYDWLLLGSSRCVVNLDPRVFDRAAVAKGRAPETFFNAGLHGFSASATLEFFERFFHASARRGVVLILSPYDVDDNRGVIQSSYGYRFFSGNRNIADRILMGSYLFRYRLQYRDLRYLYYVVRGRGLKGDVSRRVGSAGFVETQGELIDFRRRLFELLLERINSSTLTAP